MHRESHTGRANPPNQQFAGMFQALASGGTSAFATGAAPESLGWIFMVTANPASGCSRVSSIRVTPTTGARTPVPQAQSAPCAGSVARP